MEQVGATQAVNELLLQSFQGVLRFFPGWPLNESASFTTLRAVGAFLVSGKVDGSGVVQPITITSEVGSRCTMLSPWGEDIAVHSGGAKVVVTPLGAGRFQFDTVAGTTYTVSNSTRLHK